MSQLTPVNNNPGVLSIIMPEAPVAEEEPQLPLSASVFEVEAHLISAPPEEDSDRKYALADGVKLRLPGGGTFNDVIAATCGRKRPSYLIVRAETAALMIVTGDIPAESCLRATEGSTEMFGECVLFPNVPISFDNGDRGSFTIVAFPKRIRRGLSLSQPEFSNGTYFCHLRPEGAEVVAYV